MKTLISLFLLGFSTLLLAEQPIKDINVYRSPECQCCHKWISHLKDNDFNVLDKLSRNMSGIKQEINLPKPMASCHTAIIEGYIIEGHVPAEDIRRLLLEKPDIAGLSVPKMPVGTPGMEMGERKDNFIVFQFDKEGQFSPFTQYTVDEHNHYQSLIIQ
jgi:hypothetical protein